MREARVSTEAILAGVDALSDIYSHVPPLIMWRAWELDVYRHFALDGRILEGLLVMSSPDAEYAGLVLCAGKP